MDEQLKQALKKSGVTIKEQSKDQRVVYGACCSWWDTIDKVSVNPLGLPCCPFCTGVLLEVATEEEWCAGVEEHEKIHPGYIDLLKWMRGKCFPSFAMAEAAYKKEKEEA